MSSKKSGTRQSGIRDFRHSVSRLKDLGLVSKRVDARSQKMTRYMRGQVKKFDDVLTGKAKVVHAPTRKATAEYREGGRYTVKGKNVVIPVSDPKERVRWDKKTNRAVGTSDQFGQRRTKEYMPQPIRTIDDAQKLPTGSDIRYTLPLGRSYRSFDTWADLVALVFQYEQTYHRPYKNWQDYVIVERYGARGGRVSRPNPDYSSE